MLARLQQLITTGLLVSAATWASVWWAADRPGWAVAGALVFLFGHAVILAVEFAWMHATNRHEPAPRATWQQVLRAWAAEVVIAPSVFCWHQPFREFSVPDHLPEPVQAPRAGIVFVHGLVCNRAVWNPWMRRLKSADVPFIAISAEPIFGSIDGQVHAVEQAVRRITALTGCPPLIVAHSMGGLTVRSWLKQADDDTRVAQVITIATP
ncbi:MAG TPA: permease, partial [Rubrivivax sp.]|nr:permease [Rubrivivax sp.]